MKSIISRFAILFALTFLVISTVTAGNNKKFNSEDFIQKVMKGKIVLRGVHTLIPVGLTPKDKKIIKQYFRELKEKYHANHIVLQLWARTGTSKEEANTLVNPIKFPINSPNEHFWHQIYPIVEKEWLSFFEEIQLPVILYMDPGIKSKIAGKNDAPLWTDEKTRKDFVDFITEGAKICKDSNIIIGYCLLNEPLPPGSIRLKKEKYYMGFRWSAKIADKEVKNGSKIYASIMNELIGKIRQFDNKKIILLQAGPFGHVFGIEQNLDIIDDPRLIFRIHHYYNYDFTHCNIAAWKKKNLSILKPLTTYPSSQVGVEKIVNCNFEGEHLIRKFINNKWYIDKTGMNEGFKIVRKFQKKREKKTGRKCLIQITEFGTIRWLDKASQKRWYTDSLNYFEDYGWGWSFFGYWPWSTLGSGISQHDVWACSGPTGEDLDIKAYIQTWSNGEKEFKKYRNSIGNDFHDSFRLVLERMGRNETVLSNTVTTNE